MKKGQWLHPKDGLLLAVKKMRIDFEESTK